MAISYKFSSLARIGLAGALALGLAACESADDAERKPGLVDEIVSTSLERCDLQEEFAQSVTYETRLEEALMGAYSSSLDFVIENDITICLDQRLEDASHDKGFMSRTAHALYYPDQNVMTLFDNGDDEMHSGSFETTASDYSGRLIDKFEYKFDADDLSSMNDIHIGYRRSGKGSKYRWYSGAEDYGVVENNAELLTPPLNE